MNSDEIKIRIPSEIRQILVKLAREKNTTFNNIVLLLINQLISRKPDLESSLKTSITLIGLEQRIFPQYLKLISAYSLMKTEFVELQSKNKLGNKISNFILESDRLIEQFSLPNEKEGLTID